MQQEKGLTHLPQSLFENLFLSLHLNNWQKNNKYMYCTFMEAKQSQRFRSIESRANCWRVRNLRHPGSKTLLVADFHLEFHNYTPPTYTRWKLKLNFFDVCHLTYAGLLAQLDKWSLQYGRHE